MIHIHNDGDPLTMEQRKSLASILTEHLDALAVEKAHTFHEWEPSKLNQSGVAIEFQCVGCLIRWGWTGTEWGYLAEEGSIYDGLTADAEAENPELEDTDAD